MACRLLDVVTLLSSLLCVAIIAVCVRSYFVVDMLRRKRREPADDLQTQLRRDVAGRRTRAQTGSRSRGGESDAAAKHDKQKSDSFHGDN